MGAGGGVLCRGPASCGTAACAHLLYVLSCLHVVHVCVCLCAAEPGMALLNQSFLLRGPLPDSTAYRSRYLCPLATRRWCDPPVLLSQHRLVSCSFTCSYFFSRPPPPGPVLSPLGRDNRQLGPSDPLSLCVSLCCLPTAAYACLRTYHLAVVSGTCLLRMPPSLPTLVDTHAGHTLCLG